MQNSSLFEQLGYIRVKWLVAIQLFSDPPWVSTTWCIFSGREHAKFLGEMLRANDSPAKDIISCGSWITVLNFQDSLDSIYDGLKSFRDPHRLLDVSPRNLFFFSAAPNRKYNKYAIEF